MVFRPGPVVIGHRGFGAGVVDGFTENTVESYLAAVKAGATWVEFDVRRSADDRLVLHHDPSIDGRFIVDRTAEENARDGVHGIEEALDAIPVEIGVDIDVKPVLEDAVDPPERRTGALLAPLLRREAERRPVFVTSFDPAVLLELKREVPGLKAGLLGWVRFPLDIAVPMAAGLGVDAIGLDARTLGQEGDEPPAGGRRPIAYAIDTAHRAGLEVLAWCPGPEDAVRYVAAGADALVVNDIPGVLTALRHPPTTPI